MPKNFKGADDDGEVIDMTEQADVMTGTIVHFFNLILSLTEHIFRPNFRRRMENR